MFDRFLLPVLLISVATLVLLATLLLLKRISRSGAERRSKARRERFRAATTAGRREDLRAMAREVCQGPAAEEDLIFVLDALDGLDQDRLGQLHQAIRDAGLDHFICRRLRSRRGVTRARAALLAGLLRLPGVVAALEPLLFDRDSDVRHDAVRAIALDRSKAAVGALLRALAEEALAPSHIVERLGHPWAGPALLARFDREGPGPVRAYIAEALGLARDPGAEGRLVALLESDDCEERVQACRALGRLAVSARPDLFIKALDDPFWPVRAQAARVLGEIGDPAAVEALAEHLADRAWWVRANCAEALRKIRPAGIAALRRSLDHADPFARDRAAEALALEIAARAAPPPVTARALPAHGGRSFEPEAQTERA